LKEAEGFELVREVSIHAPAWGATRLPREGCAPAGFQSTRPRGARLGHVDDFAFQVAVSIHAPAWGATSVVMPHLLL